MNGRHLTMFGLAVLLATVAVPSVQAFHSHRPTDNLAKVARAEAYVKDIVAADPYDDGYRRGHEQGLREAADRDCRRPDWWRSRKWWEQRQPYEVQQDGLGFFDGYEAAYRKVCKVIKPRF